MIEIELAELRMRLDAIRLQMDDATRVVARISRMLEEARADVPPAQDCQHPKEARTDITSMGDTYKKFYCSLCRATVETNQTLAVS